ncbi:hypothetical protein Acr_05g0005980 [Actinidia rufa]|uniref:Uncharacterized protein n=1 Tax=Actinidia rufa TaxID=165716 RepID=A0A7J0ELW5_9ERIC|nr:hypothetical protein Acr_05g0005980 [Actinidia rufa]
MLRNILGIVVILSAQCGHCSWDITCLYLIAHGEHGPTGGISYPRSCFNRGVTTWYQRSRTCHHATREGRAKSLTGARGARRNHDEEDDGNHQELVMGGGASAPRGNMGGAPPTTLGGTEFMQGVFTAIEQVVRNTVQTMQVPVRTAKSKPTTAMKAFLQLRPPTFKGEPDPLVVEDWGMPSNGGRPWRKWFAKVFVSTEKEKAKQFMRGLRPSIRNKIAGNLIKVYSTMVSAAAAIEETLNETRKIQNPKSQREGTSNQSEGRSSKKPRNFTAQQQYPVRSSPATSVVSSGQTSWGGPICFGCHQPGNRIVDCPLKGQQRQSQQGGQSHIQAQGQSLVKGPPTYYRQFKPQGPLQHYISTDFISVQTIGCSSVGSEDARTSLRYNISSGTVGDSWTAGATIGYLYCARYFTYV